MLCALIAAVTTVFFVNIRGIKTSGKVVYFTATFPYVSLIALLIRGATLDGASMGIRAYLLPDLSQLAKAQVWVDAASQAVYSYGIGFVALTAMGGYNNYTDNFYRSSFFIAAIGTVTSFTMGFATFSVLGHLSHVMGVNINDVVQSGPGLVFQVLPVALGLLPASQVWSALFFLMIYFVAIDSAFAEFEGLVTILGDAVPGLISTPLRRVATNTVLGFVYFLVCSSQLSKQGIYIFELIFFYGASGISLIFIVLVETIAVGWLWDAAQFKRDVKQMTGSDLSRFFIYCYKYVTPLVSLVPICYKTQLS
uniref:Sodium- and chloride-dependent GABA transporter 3-like n=1 Tax=Phallusia mammillata TaxID=59560 RepID=A0A6F9DS86_9ASCI|nr:sodium- and chloride-dependent GABA transporter 3-like [Phallusia mammillata]